MPEELGELFIDIKIDWKKVNRSLSRISTAVSKVSSKMGKSIRSALGGLVNVSLRVTSRVVSIFTNAFKRVVRIVRNAMLLAAASITAFLIISTKMAIDVEEMQSLFEKSFGDMSDDVKKWSNDYSKSVKTNRFETQSMITTFFNVARAMKLTDKQAADTAKELVSMSNDLKSAFNLKGDVAFEKIRSGIIGMSKPLQDLGIDLRVAAVEEFALSQGMKKVNGEFTQQQNIMARTGLLKQTLKSINVIGDMEDTLDSTQNRIRAMVDGFKEFQIGQGALIKDSKSFAAVLGFVEVEASKLQKIFAGKLKQSIDAIDKHFANPENVKKWTAAFTFAGNIIRKVADKLKELTTVAIKWLLVAENQQKLLGIWDDFVAILKKVKDEIILIGKDIKRFFDFLDKTFGDSIRFFKSIIDKFLKLEGETTSILTKIITSIIAFKLTLLSLKLAFKGLIWSIKGFWKQAKLTEVALILLSGTMMGVKKAAGFVVTAFLSVGKAMLILATKPIKALITNFGILIAAIPGWIAGLTALKVAVIALKFALYAGALAAAAFVGWKIGKWAYDNIPGVSALSDALANLVIWLGKVVNLIPGLNIGGIGTFDNDDDVNVATRESIRESKRFGGGGGGKFRPGSGAGGSWDVDPAALPAAPPPKQLMSEAMKKFREARSKAFEKTFDLTKKLVNIFSNPIAVKIASNDPLMRAINEGRGSALQSESSRLFSGARGGQMVASTASELFGGKGKTTITAGEKLIVNEVRGVKNAIIAQPPTMDRLRKVDINHRVLEKDSDPFIPSTF